MGLFFARVFFLLLLLLIIPIDFNRNRTNIEIDTHFGNTHSGLHPFALCISHIGTDFGTHTQNFRTYCIIVYESRYGLIGMFVAHLLFLFHFSFVCVLFYACGREIS